MTYLLIYLALGVLFGIIMTYHDYVMERSDSFSLADLFDTLIAMVIWPVIVFILLSEYLPTIDFNPDRIILWRRSSKRTGLVQPVPGLVTHYVNPSARPLSESNDPDA